MRDVSRKSFLKCGGFGAASVGALLLLGCSAVHAATEKRPNVVLIMTDDQGYSDFGYLGNPHLSTPVLDTFSEDAVRLDRFYVSPVCIPTRAKLMTGRAYQRVGEIYGERLMAPDEYTLAEAFADGGYSTGMFGKWHLGDNYPMRPQDQGFDDVLSFVGGMIGDFYNPIEANSYQDPLLLRNGKEVACQGFSTDIFVDTAMDFIEAKARADQPFFVYLPFNTPHHPLIVPDKYAQPYLDKGLSVETSRHYGMISNLDENVGRLLDKLNQLSIADDTIVIFTCDNGTSFLQKEDDLWQCGLRGCKGYVFENGIRVPFIINWPNGFKGGRRIDTPADAIDIMPTLVEACGLEKPSDVKFDGVSLLGLLQGDELRQRELYYHWGPAPMSNFAVITREYKLVQARNRKNTDPEKFVFELFKIDEDPQETNNIIDQHPKMVEGMKQRYMQWYEDVNSSRPDKLQRIHIGTDHENPVYLTRESWRGAGFKDHECGYWEVDIKRPGKYKVVCRITDLINKRHEAYFRVGDTVHNRAMLYREARCIFESIELPAGKTQIEGWVDVEGNKNGFRYITVERLD